MNPLLCERCGRDLETDDAISIIEGVCCVCRRVDAQEQLRTGGRLIPPTPPPASPPRFPHRRSVPQPRRVIDNRVSTTPAAASRAADAVSDTSSDSRVWPRIRRRRRDLVIGVSVGLLLTFAATGYILTQKGVQPQLTLSSAADLKVPVRLTVKPAWADVAIGDRPIGPPNEIGQIELALPTDSDELHWLTVAAEGYHTIRRPLSALSGVGDISIELVQKPIDVTIRSEPPDAKVWIDEQYKGNTPLNITMLPWDSSTLSIQRDGFQVIKKSIRPPSKGNQLELDFAMQPAGLLVRVETQPSGAIVAIDGRVAGATPLDVPLDAGYRGSEIEIDATLAGYDRAIHRLRLPDASDGQPIVARLALIRPQSELMVNTQPPGAEVLIGGKSYGASPAVAVFGPEHAGQRITVEGRIPGSYSGRTSVLVPPGGQKRDVKLELQLTGQRVVFLILSPTGAGTDHVLLTDHLIEQIHRLEEAQQFSVISCTIDGLAAWPALGQTVPATSDHKIRAYDLVRGLRPSARGAVVQAMEAALQLQPNTVWLFTGPKLVTEDLRPFGDPESTDGPTVHAVQIAGKNKPIWLEQFVQARGGVLTTIEPGMRRMMAQDGRGLD